MPSPYSSCGHAERRPAAGQEPRHRVPDAADHAGLQGLQARCWRRPSRGSSEDVAEENIQARVRGTLLMALSQQVRLARADHRQQERDRRRLLHALRRHGRRLRGHQGRAEDAGLRGLAATSTRGPGAPSSRSRSSTARRRPSCGRTRPTRTRCRPTTMLDAILQAYVEEDRGVSDLVARGFDRGDRAPRRSAWSTVNEYKRRQAPHRRQDHAARVRPRLAPAHRQPLPRTLTHWARAPSGQCRSHPSRDPLGRALLLLLLCGHLALPAAPGPATAATPGRRAGAPRSSCRRAGAATTSRTARPIAWPTRCPASGSSRRRSPRCAPPAAATWRCPLRQPPGGDGVAQTLAYIIADTEKAGAGRCRARSSRSPAARAGALLLRFDEVAVTPSTAGRTVGIGDGGGRAEGPAAPPRRRAVRGSGFTLGGDGLDDEDARRSAPTLETTDEPQCWRHLIRKRSPGSSREPPPVAGRPQTRRLRAQPR